MSNTEPKPGDRIQCWAEGFRRYTVVEVGRRWVTLLDTTTIHAFEIDMRELLSDRSYCIVDSNPRTIRRIIKENLSMRRKLGLRVSVKAAKTALKLLEQPR